MSPDLERPFIVQCAIAARVAAERSRLAVAARTIAQGVAGVESRERPAGRIVVRATSVTGLTAFTAELAARGPAFDASPVEPLLRDTPRRTAEAEATVDRADAFAVVRIRLIPLPRGAGVQFESEFEGPPPIDAFNAAVAGAVQAAAAGGTDGGRPLDDLKAVFAGGAYDPARPAPAAFEEAARSALAEACRVAGLNRLDPMVSLTLRVGRDDVRAVIDDLATVRGHEVKRALTANGIVIDAVVPADASMRYADRLAALTDGRAAITGGFEFTGYAETR